MIFNIFRFELPYIEYVILKPYIAKNLCVNKDKPNCCCEGKCFREKQLRQINSTRDTEQSNEKNSNKKAQSKDTKEFLKTPQIRVLPVVVCSHIKVHIELFLETIFVSTIFIPPQSS
jgi:hypothetical protein